MNPKYKTWEFWRDEWVKPGLIALVIAIFIRTFIAQPFKIPTSSMEPTFVPGDRIFVNKFIYGARIPFVGVRLPKVREPERGDVIVFLSPIERKYLVKRLIGEPGDTVEIKDRKIRINGRSVEQPLVLKGIEYYNAGNYGRERAAIKVPEEHFYALGDNSRNSVDSRYWGFVPKRKLVGKAFLVWWPPNRIRIVK